MIAIISTGLMATYPPSYLFVYYLVLFESSLRIDRSIYSTTCPFQGTSRLLLATARLSMVTFHSIQRHRASTSKYHTTTSQSILHYHFELAQPSVHVEFHSNPPVASLAHKAQGNDSINVPSYRVLVTDRR